MFRFFPLLMIEAKARVPKMHEASLSSLIVPYGADQTLYVVVDRVSGAKEIRIERTDLDSTIGELIAGCFSDPVRVMSFNTLEHWTQDISTEIATEIQARCDIDGTELPDHIKDFVESHIRGARYAAASYLARVLAGASR